jgi:hypothetical protein
MNPIADGSGQAYAIQLNMQTTKQLGEDPEPKQDGKDPEDGN